MDDREGLARPEPPDPRQGPVRPVPPQARVTSALTAVVPLVRKAAGALWRLALAAAAGGAVLWWLLADRVISADGRAVGLVVWAVVLLAAPVILLVVGLALRALAGMPEQLATLPARAQERAGEIGRLAEEVRRERRRGWVRSGVAVFRLWRGAASSRELLELAGPVAFLFNPGTWLAAMLAILVALAELLAGVVALLILLAS
jgi:hypothetical protein